MIVGLSLSFSLIPGTLGGTGNAGYLPVVHIGQPKEGEIAFVSGAAGATGLVACQSLKLLGCSTVVGSAGSDDKVALLEVTREIFHHK